jgi:hypothetical protein
MEKLFSFEEFDLNEKKKKTAAAEKVEDKKDDKKDDAKEDKDEKKGLTAGQKKLPLAFQKAILKKQKE